MDRRLMLVLIMLTVISGCVKPETLSEKNVTGKPIVAQTGAPGNASSVSLVGLNGSGQMTNLTDVVVTQSNISLEDGVADSGSLNASASVEPAKPMNRIDAKIGAASTSVTALWNGKTDSFTVLDVDRDAVAFDIAQRMGKGIREVRPFLYINGEAYLKPTELKKELAKYTQSEIEAFNVSTIPIFSTKGEGFIRGVGCDLEKRYFRVDVVNPSDKGVTLYKDAGSGPKVKDALVISLNRRLLGDLNCGGSMVLNVGGNVSCVKGEAIFISGGSMNQADTNASYDTSKPDVVFATRPGYHESISFFCR